MSNTGCRTVDGLCKVGGGVAQVADLTSSVSARIAAREDQIALEEERRYEEEKRRKKEGTRSVGGMACPRYTCVGFLFLFFPFVFLLSSTNLHASNYFQRSHLCFRACFMFCSICSVPY